MDDHSFYQYTVMSRPVNTIQHSDLGEVFCPLRITLMIKQLFYQLHTEIRKVVFPSSFLEYTTKEFIQPNHACHFF